MKLLLTSDIHQWGSKWKTLVAVCQSSTYDAVVIAGDIVPKEGSIADQDWFIPHLKKYVAAIKYPVFIILGNDDSEELHSVMEEGDKEGLWHYVHGTAKEFGGYHFAGCSFVPDYPFRYKGWVRAEYKGVPRIDPYQLGSPCIVKNGMMGGLGKSLKAYLDDHASIYDSLCETAEKVPNMAKSIWLIHGPPTGCGLDVTSRGQMVGSDSIRQFISEHQPLLAVHGHIHESPVKSGKWQSQIDKTLCIQGGQVGTDLHYVDVELDGESITSVRHSIYGKG